MVIFLNNVTNKDVVLHPLAVQFSPGGAVQFSPGTYNQTSDGEEWSCPVYFKW